MTVCGAAGLLLIMISSLVPDKKPAAVKEQETRMSFSDTDELCSDTEKRLKELDQLLMVPENASDMMLVTEYTTTKAALDKEVERWEQLSEELEGLSI